MNWRRNTGYNRRIIRYLVQVRGSEDLNWGHEIMSCVFLKRMENCDPAVLSRTFKQDNGDGSIGKRAQEFEYRRFTEG